MLFQALDLGEIALFIIVIKTMDILFITILLFFPVFASIDLRSHLAPTRRAVAIPVVPVVDWPVVVPGVVVSVVVIVQPVQVPQISVPAIVLPVVDAPDIVVKDLIRPPRTGIVPLHLSRDCAYAIIGPATGLTLPVADQVDVDAAGFDVMIDPRKVEINVQFFGLWRWSGFREWLSDWCGIAGNEAIILLNVSEELEDRFNDPSAPRLELGVVQQWHCRQTEQPKRQR